MVGDPVENRAGEHRVHWLVEHELCEVCPEDGGAFGKRLARVLHHGQRLVHRHHVAAGKALEEHRRRAARTAAGVEHGLVALEVQPVEDLLGHRHLWLRDAVVGGRVPLAGHDPRAGGACEPSFSLARSVVTGPIRWRSAS